MNIEQFDTRYFKFDIILKDTKDNAIQLNSSSVENLTIEDNIFIPFVTGSIVVSNSRDGLQTTLDDEKRLDFAGTNHDLLIVEILPTVTGNIESDNNNEKIREIFGLNFVFALNELQDLDDPSNRTSNVMNFRDIHHQFMLEKTCEITSSDIVAAEKNVDVTDFTNSERSVQTGVILKEIIKKTFEKDDDEEDTIIDVENFDLGKYKILWNSAGNSNSFQHLMHVWSKHQSEEKEDHCLIQFDRTTHKFSNISLAKIFEKQEDEPKKYVLETFIFDSNIAGQRNTKSKLGLGLDKLCFIIDHKLTPINGNEFSKNISNQVYNTHVAADRNIYLGTSNSNIQAVFDRYKELYVDSLQNYDTNVVPSIDLDQFIDNKESSQESSQESAPSTARKKTGRRSGHSNLRQKVVTSTGPINQNNILTNNMLLDLFISSGDNIIFRALGSTHRRSGKFIDIASETTLTNTTVADNILGRWFVTSVKHVFSDSQYFNIIEAVKTYRTK